VCADNATIPCVTPWDKSQSSPFQHCPLTSTSVLSVFVRRERSACAVEGGERDRTGSPWREEKAGKTGGVHMGSASFEESEGVENMRRADGRRK